MGSSGADLRIRHTALAANDMLFIDSSHQLKPGSDVEFLLNAVLPLLPAGVRVHFHDIFLPDDYPAHWGWRRYNEQAAVAALIERNILAVEFASHATVTRQPEMRDEITGIQWLGFALTEACFFYGLVAGLIAFFL